MAVILGYMGLPSKTLTTMNHVQNILALIRRSSLESTHNLKMALATLEKCLMQHTQPIELVIATRHVAYSLMSLEI